MGHGAPVLKEAGRLSLYRHLEMEFSGAFNKIELCLCFQNLNISEIYNALF
ncbi:hypothetical protein [aff. Roholtiella sp. LEGE 12411]|uniref:hypothetical protein n=1 Tax=aff. Roholtiella sp. LEGE 12411 TaxID=1828822 RepID=UPI00187E5EE1|nr:hypothetical protein [aff. Roholtiella sp. LEGE 12411]MBE9037174.1 hypothetical protein [aff. Roholtiella sp. LEGE 12411]